MKFTNLVGIYFCLMLLATFVGAIEAFVIGPFRGPQETVGGLVGITMLIAIIPVGAIAVLVFLIRDMFNGH